MVEFWMYRGVSVYWGCALVVVLSAVGAALANEVTVRDQYNWRAHDFFTDDQVVALCQAIEQGDLEGMERLIGDGANIDARGKGNMTPLLWALADDQLAAFKKLLEYDADPNVILTDDFGIRDKFFWLDKGDAVTHLVCKTRAKGYFGAVFDNGGDPNLTQRGVGFNHTPLVLVIRRDFGEQKRKLQKLIDCGADLDAPVAGNLPVAHACGWFEQFDIALFLIEAGADYTGMEEPNSDWRVINWLAKDAYYHQEEWPDSLQKQFDELVAALEARGESYEAAKAAWEQRVRKSNAAEAEREAYERQLARPFHEKAGWKAEDFFEDPRVVELCRAIEANDLTEMKRLLDKGANANARGKHNMTPLLWAYPDEKFERFELLLKHGADPNVIFETDLGTRGVGVFYVPPGTAMTYTVCRRASWKYFHALFTHGGDVNLETSNKAPYRTTPIFYAIPRSGNKSNVAKVRYLIEHGANLNYINGVGRTPLIHATANNQFRIVADLLESGADPTIRKGEVHLGHYLVKAAQWLDERAIWTDSQRENYNRVVQILEQAGISMEKAKEDVKRWEAEAEQSTEKIYNAVTHRAARTWKQQQDAQ